MLLQSGGGWNGTFTWLTGSLNFKTIALFFCFNRISFLNWALWYLFALVYVYFIFVIVIFYKKEEILCKVAPFLLVVSIIVSEVTELPWYIVGNFVFTILPCFTIGYYIHKADASLKNGVIFVLLVISVGLICVEHAVFGDAFLYTGSILFAVALFLFGKNDVLKRIGVTLSAKFGKNLSSIVFYSHCGIIQIVNAVLIRCEISPNIVGCYGFVIALTIAFSMLGYQMKRHFG